MALSRVSLGIGDAMDRSSDLRLGGSNPSGRATLARVCGCEAISGNRLVSISSPTVCDAGLRLLDAVDLVRGSRHASTTLPAKQIRYARRRPRRRAVFTEVYFSPASVDLCLNIVAKHDGRPCEKPPKEPATALLIGDESAWNELL